MYKDIVDIIKADMGLATVDQARVNRAAKHLYDEYNLIEREREITLNLTNNQLLAIPWFVDKINCFRRNNYTVLSNFIDQAWKYKSGNWENAWKNYELLSEGPVHTSITNAGPLVLAIPKAETVAFTVTITGYNNNSAQVSSEVTFQPGELIKSTDKNFLILYSITQDVLHSYNVIISDIDGKEISILYNNQHSAKYRIVRLLADLSQPPTFGTQVGYVDCLFTPVYRPFVKEFDEFPCGSRYDRAIAYKFYEEIYAGQATTDAVRLAASYRNSVETQLSVIQHNANKASAMTKITIEVATPFNLPGYYYNYDYDNYPYQYGNIYSTQ